MPTVFPFSVRTPVPNVIPIEGDLSLRRASVETAPALYQVFAENRERLMDYSDDAMWYTLQGAIDFAKFTQKFADDGLMAQYEIMLGEAINGEITMSRLTLTTASLGYWRVDDGNRTGIATKAVASVAQLGFQSWEVESIFLDIDSDNTKSQALAKRIGAVPTGAYVNRQTPAGNRASYEQWELRA